MFNMAADVCNFESLKLQFSSWLSSKSVSCVCIHHSRYSQHYQILFVDYVSGIRYKN